MARRLAITARSALANFASVARSSSGQTATVEQGELTPHEAQIARLAREGHTNLEIGAELFLSPRTVAWRPGKVFGKLGISSRKERMSSPRGPNQASQRTQASRESDGVTM